MKLHYLIASVHPTLVATFRDLFFIFIFTHSGIAQPQTFNPTYDMSSEGNRQDRDSFYLKSVEKNKQTRP